MTAPETPAALMRRAAQLMRQHAELVPPPPWFSAVHDVTTHDGLDVIASSWLTVRAQYVASWHPGVALAVADLLERDAAIADAQVFPRSDPAMERYSLAVARAYLGEPEATHG